jgi:hypothetical protein
MIDTTRTGSGERLLEPGLETAMAAGRRGEIEFVDVMKIFVGWPILVCSHEDPAKGSEFMQPLIVSAKDGTPLIAVFTSPGRVGAWNKEARFVTNLAGGMIAKGAQGGAGIVINPGTDPTLEIFPQAMGTLAGFPREVLPERTGGRPLTPYEVAVAQWAARYGSFDPVLAALRDNELIFPGSAEPEGQQQFVGKVAMFGGVPHLAAYTHPDLVRADQTGPMLYSRTSTIRGLGSALEPGKGIVLNPGTAFTALISPAQVDSLR